jgi:SagB-type dehydrogenase family enzyme
MSMKDRRDFLKDSIRLKVDFSQTAQSQGYPPPPVEKPVPEDAVRIKLPLEDAWLSFRAISLVDAILNRRSRRGSTKIRLSLLELSFLLYATQGVIKKELPYHAFRVVPSAGCRHAFETYVAALRVEKLDKAIYRYMPLSHELIVAATYPDIENRVTQAVLGQTFAGQSAAVFFWTTIPARMEWRYAEAAHKVIALDAGHVCQNLYLAGEATGCGICAIAAYDQELSDTLVAVDGEEEYAIYIATVSKRDL